MALRVMQIHPGLVPPPQDPTRAEFYHIGGDVTGDVLLPTWAKTKQDLQGLLGSFPTYRVNQFSYRMELAGQHPYGTLRQKWQVFRFYLKTALQLRREQPYDCVKSYGSGLTGLTALLLAKLLHSKFIVEIPNVPEDSYRFARFGNAYQYAAKPDLRTRVARTLSQAVLHLVVGSADHVQLLYPWQLKSYPRLQQVPSTVVHPFVTVSKVPPGEQEDGSVLLVGSPWYVKGVDILIRAWRKIEHKFPQNKLRLLGYFPEQDLLREMIGDSRQIEVLPACPNPEVLQTIARCSIFVLASRTEGAGRVFIEAMAAGKPVIGPRIGGVPHYVRQGVNGFLFESENSDDLAQKLEILLASPHLREKFGKAGRVLATTEFDEATFGRRVEEMLELTVYGALPVRQEPQPVQESQPAREKAVTAKLAHEAGH